MVIKHVFHIIYKRLIYVYWKTIVVVFLLNIFF